MANVDVSITEFRDACELVLRNVTAGNTSDSTKATIKYDDRQGDKIDVSYKSKPPPPPPTP